MVSKALNPKEDTFMANKRSIALASVLFTAIGAVALAGDLAGHPHLKQAHNHIGDALKALTEAHDGKIEYGGHREKAEALLHQAQHEIEEAGEFATQHKK
jgi:hypothetical protein